MCVIRKYLNVAIQAIPQLKLHCSDSSDAIGNVAFDTAVKTIQSSQLQNKAFSLSHVKLDSVIHIVKPQNETQEQNAASGDNV